MKLFKKTAALLFCLALALSVMAISASADEEAATVTMTLVEASDGYYDYDNDSHYEVPAAVDNAYAITYNIQLTSNKANTKINGIAFQLNDPAVTGVTRPSAPAITSLSQNMVLSNGADVVGAGNVNSANQYWTFYSPVSGSGDGLTATDITIADANTATTIGTITFQIATTCPSDTQYKPTLSNITLTERGFTTKTSIASVTATGFKVDPTYTITLIDKELNPTTFVAENVDEDDYRTLTYHFTNANLVKTVEGDSDVTYASGAIPDGDFLGINNSTTESTYDFAYWEVTTAPANGYGWVEADATTNPPTESSKFDSDDAIPAQNVGNVTLTAVYTPRTYTITYVLTNNTTAAVGFTSSNATPYYNGTSGTAYAKTTYTVEDFETETGDGLKIFNTETSGTMNQVNAPTWPGLTFTGWSAAKNTAETANAYTEYNSANWATATGNGASVTAGSLVGVYGNVTLTAQCKENGAWVATDYAYASGTDSLILYAVETPVANATYKLGSNVMYQVDTAKYKDVSSWAQAGVTGSVTVGAGWTIYAYLAPATSGTRPNIQIDTTTSSCENTVIQYNGSIDGAGTLDAGDFGNLNTLLLSKTAISGYSVITVAARLNADLVSSEGDSGSHFGTIADVKWIADRAGQTATAPDSAT